MSTYSFSTSSFVNELWINGRRVFKKPTGASVEFTNGGAFDWVFADTSGRVVKTYRAQNPNGGWRSIDLSSLGLFGDYSIGFRNASSGRREIRQGDVVYTA
jgi:hypothetical protein